MKASQYLYTSWKNAPNHGFSIYSTSPDVTREESMHIALVMKYRAPSDLPYEPTEEQIATLFPRNTAYFRLPTGRYCIAQSTYVGHEYKGFEEAGRMGNYLTHAYIFDEPAEFYPATFIDDPVFRRDLTLDEWRATNPAPLPVVDLPVRGTAAADVSAFLKGKEELLAKLVQAVSEGADKTVFLNDTQENMKLWYAALGLCLPKRYNARLTFNTFSFEDINANFKVPADCRLAVVNLTAGGFVPVNWQQKMTAGACVFDFKTQTVSPVTPKQYAQKIVLALSRDAGHIAEDVAEIERIAVATGTDLDAAFDVLALEASNYDAFKTDEELGKVYDLAVRDPMFRKEKFAEAVLPRLIGNCFAPAANALLKEFYPILSEASRNKTVAEISQKYLARPAPDAASYLAEISQNAPFPWQDFALCHYAQEEGMAYFRTYASDFAKANLLIDAAVKAEPALERVYGKDTVKKYFAKMVEFYAMSGENEKVKTLLARAEGFSGYIALVQKAVNVAAQGCVDLDWYLELVMMQAASPAAVESVESNIKFLIRNYQDRDGLIRKYDRLSAGSLAAADANLRRDPALSDFYVELDKYRLTGKDMGIPELTKFYADFYLRGQDKDGILLAQIEGYLGRRVGESSRPAEAIALYKSFSRVQAPEGDVLARIYRYAFEKVTLSRMAELIADWAVGTDYADLAKVMASANYDMVNFTVAQLGARFDDKNFPQLLEEAGRKALYAPLFGTKDTQRLVDCFYAAYHTRVAALAAYGEKKTADKRAKPEEKMSPEDLFGKIFYPLLNAKDYAKFFSEGLLSLKKQEEVQGTVSYIINFVATQKDPNRQIFDAALKTYFDALGKGDRKKLFEYAKKYNEGSGDAVPHYLDAYTAAQTTGGLFSRLFGKKK